jgi:hypothetical protein
VHNIVTISFDKLDGLSDVDRAALRSKNIDSAEQFWSAMSNDPDLISGLGLPDVDAQKRVTTTLARLAQSESKAITSSWFAGHIPDFVVLAIFLSIMAAIVLVDRSPEVVIARNNVGPFHVITRADVEIRNARDNTAAEAVVNRVIGRYATQEIAKGGKVDPSKLSAGTRLSNELDGLRVFTLKLQPTSVLAGIKPPAKVGIILSPRTKEDDKKAPIHQVYVLDIRSASDGIWVVVAGTEAETQELSADLSAGQLIAVGPSE